MRNGPRRRAFAQGTRLTHTLLNILGALALTALVLLQVTPASHDPSWAFLRALGQPTPKAKCYHPPKDFARNGDVKPVAVLKVEH